MEVKQPRSYFSCAMWHSGHARNIWSGWTAPLSFHCTMIWWSGRSRMWRHPLHSSPLLCPKPKTSRFSVFHARNLSYKIRTDHVSWSFSPWQIFTCSPWTQETETYADVLRVGPRDCFGSAERYRTFVNGTVRRIRPFFRRKEIFLCEEFW